MVGMDHKTHHFKALDASRDDVGKRKFCFHKKPMEYAVYRRSMPHSDVVP